MSGLALLVSSLELNTCFDFTSITNYKLVVYRELFISRHTLWFFNACRVGF